jgi:WD40 repeat protein
VQKLSSPRDGVSCLTFSPDGDLLAGLCRSAVLCWTRSRNWEKTGLDHEGPITGLAFHPGGRTLAYAAIARSESAPAPFSPPPPGAHVPSVWRRSFAREDRRSFTGVLLYPLTGTDEFVPNRLRVPHEGLVHPGIWARGLAFTPDGRALLAAQVEQAWADRTAVNVYHWHFTEADGVWRVDEPAGAVGPTERGGALVGSDLVLAGLWGVAVCPVTPPTGLFVPEVRTAGAVAVATQRELVAVWDNRALSVWSLRAGERVARARVSAPITALAFAPDGTTLTVGNESGVTASWEPLTGACGPERDYDVGPITALAYAPDGLTLAVGGRTGLVVVDTE